MLAEASERGALPRGKLKGGVGRGAGVGIVGKMPVGASGGTAGLGSIGVGRTVFVIYRRVPSRIRVAAVL